MYIDIYTLCFSYSCLAVYIFLFLADSTQDGCRADEEARDRIDRKTDLERGRRIKQGLFRGLVCFLMKVNLLK